MPNFVDGIDDRMIIRDGLFGLASLGRLMNNSPHVLSDMSNLCLDCIAHILLLGDWIRLYIP